MSEYALDYVFSLEGALSKYKKLWKYGNNEVYEVRMMAASGSQRGVRGPPPGLAFSLDEWVPCEAYLGCTRQQESDTVTKDDLARIVARLHGRHERNNSRAVYTVHRAPDEVRTDDHRLNSVNAIDCCTVWFVAHLCLPNLHGQFFLPNHPPLDPPIHPFTP